MIHFAVGLGLLLFAHGCGNQCIGEGDIETLMAPTDDEYRLVLTNVSGQMVELRVDGESVGAFCPGVDKLQIGNYPRQDCSRIEVEFFDVDRIKRLDDCGVLEEPECLDNNTEGRTCFDTTINIVKVDAEIR